MLPCRLQPLLHLRRRVSRSQPLERSQALNALPGVLVHTTHVLHGLRRVTHPRLGASTRGRFGRPLFRHTRRRVANMDSAAKATLSCPIPLAPPPGLVDMEGPCQEHG
jgi:hypothetical protein